ncbi:MAG TPA: hypothetical protein DDZ96_01460 [Porphyromonadaceae bacterium]|jgi:uncharacterized membrane-anchored protein YitT (DUF2179 family)|uniref:YitT family protein n=1 Tax=Limibacterium fermenti TaxID=3229863 RepID=UPI000E8A92D5|nr:hypothetical protein [Porphyromonadaceae bacterium]HBK30906.1 hypothetical protein [Porphyromonadaceae bacterium]HBL32472.1 hypothetical protein [Porphyromonadaceae bacterium]HBX46032.1 hypothetical protein [Porphyromonadaceae bacterium]HCM20048.1 hypothetical protein [Porphyromonadaceae bacterium]
MNAQLKKYELKKFFWKDYLTIMMGTAMYAIGITLFIMPHHFVTGGLTGIAILMNYAFGMPVSLTILGVNIFLILAAIKILGSQFLLKTIIGVGSLTLFIGLLEGFPSMPVLLQEDPLIAGMIGAILCGGGLGLVFSVNGSTGGTDIVVMVINKYRNVTPGRIMLVIDLTIVSSSYIIFQSIETILFGIIIIAVMTTSVDYVINGIRQSVQFLIFSKKYEEIATEINLQLHRGCTVLDGVGWYSQKPQKVVVVLAKRTESVSIFRIVKGVDPNAFVSQASVIGVYGEGFDKMK